MGYQGVPRLGVRQALPGCFSGVGAQRLSLRGFEAEPLAVEGKGGKTGVDEPKGAIRWQLKRSGRGKEGAKNE
jgi:hypothetical protein